MPSPQNKEYFFCSTFKHRTAYTRNVLTIRLSLSRLKIERTRASQPSNRAKAFIRTTSIAWPAGLHAHFLLWPLL